MHQNTLFSTEVVIRIVKVVSLLVQSEIYHQLLDGFLYNSVAKKMNPTESCDFYSTLPGDIFELREMCK